MKRILFVIAAFVFVSTFAASSANPVNEKPATGTQGMVSSRHPLATQAGLDVLAAGGNAFDAALAVAAV